MKYLTTIALFLWSAETFAQLAISLEKMNVLYASGVENPLSVAVTDVPDSNLLLMPSTGEIHRTGLGHYIWTICHRDTSFATLDLRDMAADTLIKVLKFRLKRIPDPSPVSRGTQEKISHGIAVVLNSFDFDLKCDVLYYDVEYIPKGEDSIIKRNNGARFSSEVTELVNKAKPGDVYIFNNIAYRCGCDPMVRRLSEELWYKIRQ